LHLTRVVTPALDGIIRALSDRGGQTEAQRKIRADQSLIMILSFLPRDVVEMTLAGQTVMFNELLADAASDVLRGMEDTMKLRTRSTIVALGRLTQGHVDRLLKRGNQPHRTEVSEGDAAKKEPVRQAPVEPAAVAAAPDTTAPTAATPSAAAPPAMTEPTAVKPPADECWLKQPGNARPADSLAVTPESAAPKRSGVFIPRAAPASSAAVAATEPPFRASARVLEDAAAGD
jgi:hypothetical protein